MDHRQSRPRGDHATSSNGAKDEPSPPGTNKPNVTTPQENSGHRRGCISRAKLHRAFDGVLTASLDESGEKQRSLTQEMVEGFEDGILAELVAANEVAGLNVAGEDAGDEAFGAEHIDDVCDLRR